MRLLRSALPPDPGPEPGQPQRVPGKAARGSWAPTAQLTTVRCGLAVADLLVCLESSYPHIHIYSSLSPSVSRALSGEIGSQERMNKWHPQGKICVIFVSYIL